MKNNTAHVKSHSSPLCADTDVHNTQSKQQTKSLLTRSLLTQSLGTRLQVLHDMVMKSHNNYSDIWDCCCDHGYLGTALLQSVSQRHIQEQVNKQDVQATNIYFVDTVEHIIEKLTHELSHSFAQYNNWHTKCMSASDIKLGNNSNLVIIAGVGGDLCCEILHRIISNNVQIQEHTDFLLCPANRAEVVREYLVNHKFYTHNEQLIFENKRYYEAMLVSTNKASNSEHTSHVGTIMWDSPLTPLQTQYIHRQQTSIATQIQGLQKSMHSTSADKHVHNKLQKLSERSKAYAKLVTRQT